MRFAARSRRLGSTLVLAGVVAVAAAVSAAPAATASSGCAGAGLSRPFVAWGDLGSYELAPNGGFENGSSDWSLTGGAARVAGNESFYVGGSGDGFSLALPAGGTATSASVCVGVDYPTFRVFVRNQGSPLSTLRVQVVYRDLLGLTHADTVALLLGASTWQLSPQLAVLANLSALPLLADGAATVSFRFAAADDGGDWSVDDLYVDPFIDD